MSTRLKPDAALRQLALATFSEHEPDVVFVFSSGGKRPGYGVVLAGVDEREVARTMKRIISEIREVLEQAEKDSNETLMAGPRGIA